MNSQSTHDLYLDMEQTDLKEAEKLKRQQFFGLQRWIIWVTSHWFAYTVTLFLPVYFYDRDYPLSPEQQLNNIIPITTFVIAFVLFGLIQWVIYRKRLVSPAAWAICGGLAHAIAPAILHSVSTLLALSLLMAVTNLIFNAIRITYNRKVFARPIAWIMVYALAWMFALPFINLIAYPLMDLLDNHDLEKAEYSIFWYVLAGLFFAVSASICLRFESKK